jgi:hypothetical protein
MFITLIREWLLDKLDCGSESIWPFKRDKFDWLELIFDCILFSLDDNIYSFEEHKLRPNFM